MTCKTIGPQLEVRGPREGIGVLERGNKVLERGSEPRPRPFHTTYNNLGERGKQWGPGAQIIDFYVSSGLEMVNSHQSVSDYTLKLVMIVTTTFSGGDMLPLSHTKLRL